MNAINSILLGLLQGFTEFFPVSSSGHLVIAQSFIPGFSQPGVLFDVILHAGTVLSVIIYFYKELLNISKKYIYYLLLGTVPAAVIGLLFESVIESAFRSTFLVGIALIITGMINFLTDKKTDKKEKLNYKNSFIVGVFQSLAIIPGISRSGATIFAGSKAGIERKKAAQFSFLLSIPAIVGANIFQLIKYSSSNQTNIFIYFLGFIAAFVSGYLAIKVVLKFLYLRKFKLFSYYCIFVGILTILLLS